MFNKAMAEEGAKCGFMIGVVFSRHSGFFASTARGGQVTTFRACGVSRATIFGGNFISFLLCRIVVTYSFSNVGRFAIIFYVTRWDQVYGIIMGCSIHFFCAFGAFLHSWSTIAKTYACGVCRLVCSLVLSDIVSTVFLPDGVKSFPGVSEWVSLSFSLGGMRVLVSLPLGSTSTPRNT